MSDNPLIRVFVEWYDPECPEWGGYLNSLDPNFQAVLVKMVAQFGPPTKVEYRGHSEGWVQ